jgi:hypothetical protein
VVYDNLSKGHRESVPPNAEFIHGELIDTEKLEHALKARQIEAIFYSATRLVSSAPLIACSLSSRDCSAYGGTSLLPHGWTSILAFKTCAGRNYKTNSGNSLRFSYLGFELL